MSIGFHFKLYSIFVILHILVVTRIVSQDVIKVFHPLYCYKINKTSFPLDDIEKNKAIFFIDTSCLSYHYREMTLERRQVCALESAARTNPGRKIYVMVLGSPKIPVFPFTTSARFIMNLTNEYENIKFVYVNFFEYIADTPVEKLGRILVNQYSLYSYLHANDMLKLVTLWKYGGIYFDFDVIILNSLHKVPRNFLGAESESRIGSAAMGFSSEEFGREYTTKILEEYVRKFDVSTLDNSGSNLMTRLTKMICHQSRTSKMIEQGCEAIKIYPPNYFYPIPWSNWSDLFDARQNERIWNLLEGSYMVHFWNQRSFERKLRVSSYAPYVDLARNFCPKMLALMDNYL